jgi:cytoplasmic iron level regulating protein YaaA (DUF328/UPF0246 family)
MFVILAPARNVRPAGFPGVAPEKPLFPERTRRIVEALRRYSPLELEGLLDVQPERALELYDGYQRFDDDAAATPALPSYYGAAFRNMNVPDFDAGDFAFAQARLRILSALYGLLRPADGILPHRLGLNCGFTIEGQDLYAVWGDALYRALFGPGELVVNLASQEYARLVSPYSTPLDRMVNCRFLVQRPGGARGTVATVRAARGLMARFLIKNRIDQPEGLKEFDWAGYRFIPGRSGPTEYVFIQPGGPLTGARR